MELPRLLEAISTFEKRGITFYRRFAARFRDLPQASRLWTKMSDTEAGHFAVLTLAQDWVPIGRGHTQPPPEITPGSLDEMDQCLTVLETRGEASDLALEEAVQLAISWEEVELPRILALLLVLPPEARARMLSGLLAESDLHYDCLKELAGLAGVASLEARLDRLRQAAAHAGGRSPV